MKFKTSGKLLIILEEPMIDIWNEYRKTERWHNIIHIHNNVMWDSQYSIEYSPHSVWIMLWTRLWIIKCNQLDLKTLRFWPIMPKKLFGDTTGYLHCIVFCVFKSSLGQWSQRWPTFMCDCHNLTSQAHKLTHLCASQGRRTWTLKWDHNFIHKLCYLVFNYIAITFNRQ